MSRNRCQVLIFSLVFISITLSKGKSRNRHSSVSVGYRIINGERAEEGDSPFAVEIVKKSINKYYLHCGGSVITKSIVLTAAHCMWCGGALENAKDLAVISGANDVREGVVHHVLTGICHELFDEDKATHDIGLLKVKGFFDASPGVISDKEAMEGSCVIFGWGVQSPSLKRSMYDFQNNTVDVECREQCYKMFAVLNIISEEVCKEKLKSLITSEKILTDGSQICVYSDSNQDSCLGDSGGSLVCNNMIQGIVSWGIGCGKTDVPSVNTNVSFFKDWIDEKIVELESWT